MDVIFTKSVTGRRGFFLPKSSLPHTEIPQVNQRKTELPLCELGELDVVRHFTQLSQNSFGVDTNFYPLGSCTMKYNPKICEKIAALPGFTNCHPLTTLIPHGEQYVQGDLEVIYGLEKDLCEITGMEAFTLQPSAGAHGEWTGMMTIAAYHKAKGNSHKNIVLIPDEAHGTNPASATMAGFKIKPIPTSPNGMIDIEAVRAAITPEVGAIMLTNPNTLGIFNSGIKELSDLAHSHDILLYYDGANFNATIGKFRPGDDLFDVLHFNLHKTFATPHGGGGPGSGPIGVKKHLVPFLPGQRVVCKDNHYTLTQPSEQSIGAVAPFFGNFLVYLKAWIYIRTLGRQGLIRASEGAVLNANYIMHKLKDYYDIPYLRTCMHEFVLSASRQAKNNVRALDIAKALIDAGYHPPTIYFPLIVKEAMMIEPTETESKETLDSFIEAMIKIAKDAENNPEVFIGVPKTTKISRPDEVFAIKNGDFASR